MFVIADGPAEVVGLVGRPRDLNCAADTIADRLIAVVQIRIMSES